MKSTCRILWARNLLMWSDLTLGPASRFLPILPSFHPWCMDGHLGGQREKVCQVVSQKP